MTNMVKSNIEYEYNKIRLCFYWYLFQAVVAEIKILLIMLYFTELDQLCWNYSLYYEYPRSFIISILSFGIVSS